MGDLTVGLQSGVTHAEYLNNMEVLKAARNAKYVLARVEGVLKEFQ
jgi:hypothetical protein